MAYMIEQLFWFLVAAMFVGFVVGWMTYKPNEPSE